MEALKYSASVIDVARLAAHRPAFLFGWCVGRADSPAPRVEVVQRTLAERLTTDTRDADDWVRGYRAGLVGSKHSVLLALDRADDNPVFRIADRVEWQSSNGSWHKAVVVRVGALPGDWPTIRVVRNDGTEQCVAITPKALRRLP